MFETEVRTTTLPSGEHPVLGLGTWRMAEARARSEEVDALRLGIDLGMTVIDTAEMYADGAAESPLGRRSRGARGQPPPAPHQSPRSLPPALAWLHPSGRDRRRLRPPRRRGKVHHWGVSNFDVSDMEDLADLPVGGAVATDQVVYSLARRGIEQDLLPYCLAGASP